jgi:translation initiation factor IF-3
LRLADQFELDLVEISQMLSRQYVKSWITRNLFEQRETWQVLKAKSTQVTVKEIRFGLKQMSMIMNLKKERWEILKKVLS